MSLTVTPPSGFSAVDVVPAPCPPPAASADPSPRVGWRQRRALRAQALAEAELAARVARARRRLAEVSENFPDVPAPRRG